MSKQKAFIREERRRVRAEAEEIHERRNALNYLKEEGWMPDDLRQSHGTSHQRLKLIVGGMVKQLVVHCLVCRT